MRSAAELLRRLILAAWLVLGGQPALADNGLSEYQVKAAFIYNFAKYLEWPAESFATKDAPIQLCLVGRDVFGAPLAAIEGRKAQGRELRVRRGVAGDEIRTCHIAFVTYTEERRVAALLAQAAGFPVLTMSDIEDFAQSGGAVGFVNADQRVQFEINLQTLQRSNLRLSSEVLKLARVVYGVKSR